MQVRGLRFALLLGTTLAFAVGGAASVNAAPVVGVDYTAPLVFGTLYNGNDCAGELGQPFANCSLNGSPIIAKYDRDKNSWEFNTGLFPGVDASDFNVVVNAGGTSGTFTYTPDAGDPSLTAYVLKAGNFFKGFEYVGDGQGSAPQGEQVAWNIDWGRGLSHISFYDTVRPGGPSGAEVPEPATLALLGAGLLGLGLARRRRGMA